MSNNSSTDADLMPNCAYPRIYTFLRFSLLCSASSIAILGVSMNLILTLLFTRARTREPNLAILALMDSLLCFCYIVLFGGESIANRLKIKIIYDLMFIHVIYSFALSRAVQMAIPAMLIMTSFLRWSELSKRKYGCFRFLHTNTGSLLVGIILVLLAAARSAPMLFAITVHHYPNCSDYFRTEELWPTPFGRTVVYDHFELGCTFVQVFGSFVILLLLNIAVIFELRTTKRKRQKTIATLSARKSRRNAMRAEPFLSKLSAALKEEVREVETHEQNAIFTLAIIVSTYLICNSLHVVLTIAENWFLSLLQNEYGWNQLYLVASDMISFLFMLSSAIRLFIYNRFNPAVEKELKTMFGYKISSEYSNLAELMHNELLLYKDRTDTDGTTSTSFTANDSLARRKSAFCSNSNLALSKEESIHQNGTSPLLTVKDSLLPRRKSATALLLLQNEMQV